MELRPTSVSSTWKNPREDLAVAAAVDMRIALQDEGFCQERPARNLMPGCGAQQRGDDAHRVRTRNPQVETTSGTGLQTGCSRPGPTRGSRLYRQRRCAAHQPRPRCGQRIDASGGRRTAALPERNTAGPPRPAHIEAVPERSVRTDRKGHWLQVAGVAFRHEPSTQASGTYLACRWAEAARGRRERGGGHGHVPTTAATGQDGYTMLGAETIVGEPGAEVKALVVAASRPQEPRDPPAGRGAGVQCGAWRPCLAVTPRRHQRRLVVDDVGVIPGGPIGMATRASGPS